MNKVIRNISLVYIFLVSLCGSFYALKGIALLFSLRKTILLIWHSNTEKIYLIDYTQIGIWSFIVLIEGVILGKMCYRVLKKKNITSMAKKNYYFIFFISIFWLALTVLLGIVYSKPLDYFFESKRIIAIVLMALLILSNDVLAKAEGGNASE